MQNHRENVTVQLFGRRCHLISFIFFISTIVLCNSSYAASQRLLDISRSHRLYIGALFGYGSTTWDFLTSKNNELYLSTPIKVDEGGVAGGLLMGYEISPYFAFEGLYVHFPNANITFDGGSAYATNNKTMSMNSQSDAFSLSGKFLAPIADTRLRGYGLVGIGFNHRSDFLAKTQNIYIPVFGAGLNYSYSDHFMTELGFTYYAGHAKSELRVADDFMPFLYTVHMTFSYRI